jgi:VWFA-related protein
MRRSSGLILLSILLAATARAQAPPQPPTAPQTTLPAITVDVVVEDKDGHPVHGLKPKDFRITDNGLPQIIHTLAEHSTLAPAPPGPAFAPMPPGTFTDYTPIAPNTTLNILLLDALNTRTSDQNFIRHQLQQYVQHADPGTRIAIFGLANRLTLLQDFTSNPTTLKDIVEHKLIARTSAFLDHPTTTGASQPPSSDLATTPASSIADTTGPSAIEFAANLRQFESRTGGLETEFRVQLTLDAFNTLAHYLAAFPGRKNLLWFSSSFPLNFHSADVRQVDAKQVDAQEFNETINLLTRARVAIYPIDARGLIAQPNSGLASTSNSAPGNPHSSPDPTPETLAADTGGQAFHPTSNLAATVAQAIDAGANDYTLTYTPTPPKDDQAYHSILIRLTNSAPDLQLAYRRGYFASPASSPADAGRAAAYQHAVMSRGAPAPEALLFKVRVLPASNALETTLAPDNQLDPSVPAKGPFRRYDLDSIALPNQLTLTPQPDGSRSAAVEFLAYVFDADGRLLNATGKTLRFTATPANYSRLMHSLLRCHLELSVPDQMQTFLRIAVHDLPSNHFGVVELPTVNNLPPAVYPSAPTQANPASLPATGHPTPPQR